MVLPCGEEIERWRLGAPGFVQLYRPLGDRCDGCRREEVVYLRDEVTGDLRGPVCRALTKARTESEGEKKRERPRVLWGAEM